jgi:hypothetical protein
MRIGASTAPATATTTTTTAAAEAFSHRYVESLVLMLLCCRILQILHKDTEKQHYTFYFSQLPH